ncbi:hypothetical protein [Mesorhizobium sp. CA16]|uniref:hypothetical protein n=1 Tax=Mesorhizobium sp. CA16 TaxID=588496 RepID=UPI001CCDE23F|nr:hypothetical protein [Mesorhizobium sp. CA16]MBZ9910927.1 hypothetical protein [Mesorhizobium sp. CA16]
MTGVGETGIAAARYLPALFHGRSQKQDLKACQQKLFDDGALLGAMRMLALLFKDLTNSFVLTLPFVFLLSIP